MSESNIRVADSYALSKWESRTYPFEAQQAGRMVYYGRAPAGVGDWDGTSPEVGYVTLDGLLQTLDWKVPVGHRPVRLMIYHEDAGGIPSAANVTVDYYYRDRGDLKFHRIGGGVSGAPTWSEAYGETHENADVHYRLTLQGPDGHLIWVVPYYQYLQGKQFTGSRQGMQ